MRPAQGGTGVRIRTEGATVNDRDRRGGTSPRPARLTQDALDNLLEGCQIIDRDWRYRYVNEAAAAHGRRRREELLGRTMMEAYPGIEQTPMFAALRQCMTERVHRSLENEFTFPDGARGWFELRFDPVPEGVFILSLEITERKRAEERVAHLNAVLHGIRLVNQLIARERDRERLIRQACRLLVAARGFGAVVIGLTDETPGRLSLYATAGRVNAEFVDLLADGRLPASARQALDGRLVVRRRDPEGANDRRPALAEAGADAGEVVVALTHAEHVFGFLAVSLPAAAIADAEEQELLQEMAGDLAFALHGLRLAREHDATAAALAGIEDQFRQSQKLEAIGRLAGGVAHDFNNILQTQLGCCELMRAELPPDSRLADDLETIRSCAERAAGLTRQLLAFSRRQPLQVEVLDLNRIVTEITGLLERVIGDDIALVATLAEDLGRVRADPGQVQQIIMNLVVNARDAMPEGGRLTLETANVELDEGYARVHVGAVAGPHVLLAVTDTGCGMDAHTRSRLFEPFFTTKEQGQGTGLGLATVYGIVKQSGGNIWVYSEPDRGSTFKVYLPRVEDPLTEQPKARPAPARSEGERILVVEDDPVLRELFARMLADLGYAVELADGGEQALQAVAERGLRPDLLITDVIMPGMSGKILAERLAAAHPPLKVLYVSGYTDDTIVHHGVLDAGVAFLQKPFGAAVLAAKVRAVLAGGV
jgi:two-component system, cell cycle sensor histidine kinase and response regulator CckA